MARSKWIPFGAQQSLQRAAAKAAPPVPPSSVDVKKFGFENFGNTCYANSVLQTLYFCTPFRELLLQDAETSHLPDPVPAVQPITSKGSANLAPVRRKPERKLSTSGEASTTVPQSPFPIPSHPPTLYSALRSLFLNISTNPGEKGSVAPRAFIEKLKEVDERFRSTMHQDAHEFLNCLLNKIVEDIEEERKQFSNGNTDDLSSSVPTLASKNPPTVVTTANSSSSASHNGNVTLVHKLFKGTLTSETRCLTCETVSSRDESFLDLSIDIEQNSSVTACLRQFSASEMLCQRNKFFCDACCDLQEAEKRMKIKKLPNVLALHLKRFKIQEDGRYLKLAYRVAFPFELRLFNTVDDIEDVDRLYKLYAIVVHIGNGPHQGHYVSIIKTSGSWFVFDDENVSPIPEGDIPKYFGESMAGSAYVLYYQAVDIDLAALGLKSQESTAISSEPSEHIFPPGLTVPPDARPDSIQLSLSNASSGRTSTPSAEIPNPASSPAPTTSHTTDDDTSATISSQQQTSLTPSGLSTRLFNTIKRVPSLSTTTVERHDPKRSPSERSPRPSSSTPSLGPSIDTSTSDVPPVPPLPTLIGTVASPRPVSLSSPHPPTPEPEKEKEKGKSRGWFSKKRKSLRALEKTHVDFVPSADLPSSPVFEEPASHGQKPVTLQRRPSESSSPVSGHLVRSEPANPQEDTVRLEFPNGEARRPSTASRSSSPVSTSFFTARTGAARSRPSTAIPAHSESTPAPTRKTSLLFSASERTHNPFERKKSVDLTAISPTSSSWPHASLPQPNPHRNLPPLPPTPRHRKSSPSNGTVPSATDIHPKPYVNHDFTRTDTFPLATTPTTFTTTASLQPPPSIGAAPGNSTDSNSSGTFGLKRPTRKLSLTTPIFLSRKEKEKERRREKEQLSPAAGYAKG